MGRSILAVVVGFIVVGVLVNGTTAAVTSAFPQYFDANGGTTNTGMLLAMMAYIGVFATFGCWLAARLAPSAPMRHALIVGVLGMIVNIIVAATSWTLYPAWSHVLGILTALLWGWLGGRIRERQLASGNTPRAAVA